MTTLTLSPPLTKAPAKSTEAHLAAANRYIRDASWRCARRHYSERWLEDMTQEAAIAVWHKLEECPDASNGLIWIVPTGLPTIFCVGVTPWTNLYP